MMAELVFSLLELGLPQLRRKGFAKQRVAGAQLVGVATTSVKEKRFAKQELCRENIYMLERCVVLHCQFYNNRGKRF
jgi:hypothetical protein